ncbi:B-4DMT family transporter [Mycobacterium sp.]|uniref:B-4DMT family transporter n=1 Tax=Mycobacterium sp. TaxID=1785 RepID=UPI0025F64141|nr:B-4DMT family transporter [Mycobacterium sp.]
MTNWRLRGLVFAAAMVVVRLFQGALINAFPTQAGVISMTLIAMFTAGVLVWGVLDGLADARANPDPDRRNDLAMTWLLAGLVAGVLSGAVTWLIALFYKGLYVGGLINELTTFASFTALLVFLAGIGGAAIGRWRIDRNPAAARHGGEERVDTDVFAAVSTGAGQAAAATPTVSDEPTAVLPAYSEEVTGAIPTVEADTEQTRPAPESEEG